MGLVYKNGRPDLYRSMRRAGRVTSGYLATGIDAPLIAALEADEQDGRRSDREQARAERRGADDLERALDKMAEQAHALACDALLAAGYHQHHRGEWRKGGIPETDHVRGVCVQSTNTPMSSTLPSYWRLR